MREFLYVEDLADALIFLAENYSDEKIINVGAGEDISISDLANIISEEVGYTGNIRFNTNYPDGTMRKVMDTTRINDLGWSPKTSLRDGVRKTYEYYKNKYGN
jgi:GDP-L-fucose synthase